MINKIYYLLIFVMSIYSINSHAKNDQSEMCDSFPSNYSELMLYQDKGLLTKNKIDSVFDGIGDNKCVDKIISSGINGEWNADEVNYFQKKSILLFNEKPEKICENLNKYNRNDIRSYFRFLLDSEEINHINDSSLSKCGNYLSEIFFLAKNEYIAMRSTADKSDISIRRYIGNEFLEDDESIFLEKNIYFGNGLYKNKIVLTKSMNKGVTLYIFKNFGDNTFYNLQSSNAFFIESDILENKILKINGKNSFVLNIKNLEYKKNIKFIYDDDLELFKVVENKNIYKKHNVLGTFLTNCAISGEEFHDYNMREKC